MTESDYLNPSTMIAQCNAAISQMEKDNDALTKVENALQQFMNDEERIL